MLAIVPGCSSKELGWPGLDYCYKPPKLVDFGTAVKRWLGRKLNVCQGGCDSDSDCKKTLKCLKFASGQNAVVPGCSGEGKDGLNYCYSPNGASRKGGKGSRRGTS